MDKSSFIIKYCPSQYEGYISFILLVVAGILGRSQENGIFTSAYFPTDKWPYLSHKSSYQQH